MNNVNLQWSRDFKYIGLFNNDTLITGYVDPDIINASDETLGEILSHMSQTHPTCLLYTSPSPRDS